MTDFAFLHGGGQGGWVWAETIGEIMRQSAGSARCLALDAPGCGTKRGRETADMAFAEISRELVADVRAAGLKDVVLVGHSQAGMTMPEMAELAPDLFARLVFVTCSAPLPGKTTLDQMGMGLHGSNPDQVGWPLDPMTTSMEDRFAAMFCNDMDAEATGAFLGKLGSDMWPQVCYEHHDWRRDHLRNLPVVYVKCLRDAALPAQWQDIFAQRLHADTVVELDCGHQAMTTRPAELAAILLSLAA